MHGSGPPLLISTCWLSHLQFDWESPVWRHFLADLGRSPRSSASTSAGTDSRTGTSTDFSLEARIADLEAVADHAGFERFALMAMAQGGPPAIAYAARHPERVTRLIFYGSYAGALARPDAEELELEEAFEQLIKVGWARPDSAFRRVFTSLMIPGATEEQMRWLDELQRVSVSADTAYASRAAAQARRRRRPAPRARRAHPGAARPRRPDERLRERPAPGRPHPGARLVPLESDNHILLEDEPAWPVFVAEVDGFLGPTDNRAAAHAFRRTTPPTAAVRT